MKVAHFPKQIATYKSTLVLGSFEMIHNGHYELIKQAEKLGKRISVMIIENPSDLPGSTKEEFSSLDIRLQHLADLGVSYVTVVKFTDEIRLMEGKDFVKKIIETTKAENIVIGGDFACGRGADYKAKDIAKDFKNTTIVEPIKFNDKKISTSVIKELLTLGDVDIVKALSPFYFEVNVDVDSKGFFKFNKEPKLHAGVYAVNTIVNEVRYWSYVHVNQENVMHIIVPDLRLKNSPFKAHLTFVKLVRIIVSSTKDKVEKDDIAKVATYLKNNI